ncbi:uncharacterized protein LOC125778806 [Bactrocera dorsalis]|uniref:Uncharacterized protein LOC125778806 n=1 Tax=Bactrocera dorsalis TaxID=27457 RepID=A0ABM3JXX4_BACDO|nr:uncharacterized protein LOC125778806 [Bactrocera dorsalis]
MYELYKVKYPDTQISYSTYKHIFHTEHKLRFGFPRSDTCKVCDKYFIDMIAAENTERFENIQKLATAHHEQADKAYAQLRDDSNAGKNSQNTVVICVDMQQVIFTPNLTHSDVFYHRQYSNYNFAVHNISENTVDMYTWHETIAKRGAAEIASCIWKHITSKFSILETDQIRKLIIWSDRCVGQNNNWTMIALCHSLLIKYFSEVNQKFLTSGHSFLPCDRDFALIEKKKKTAQLYTQADVCHMIHFARPSNPLQIHQMALYEFKNFEMLVKNLCRNPLCKITAAKWIQISRYDPKTLKMRKQHNIAETWTSYNLRSQKKT